MDGPPIDLATTERGPASKPLDQDTDQQTAAENVVREVYGATPEPPPTATTAPPGSSQNLAAVRTASSSAARSEQPRLRHKETKLAQKKAHLGQHLGLMLGLPMVLLFDIVVPCSIYYNWWRARVGDWHTRCAADFPGRDPCPIAPPAQFDRDILGSAIASFGIGELWILLARSARLFLHRDACAPLLSTSRWQLDATSWVYLAAVLVALVPFAAGSALALPRLYLYGPSFLMGFLGVLMAATTLRPAAAALRLPVAINSQPRGTPLRPLVYYAAEDFLAVDGLQDREFRTRYNDRYAANPMFRRFLFNLTLWWALGVCVYIGAVSAVIWTLPFHVAFGLSLGVLFGYIACWAAVTFVWVKIEMRREHEAYERGDFDV